jgi:hypothetical protein
MIDSDNGEGSSSTTRAWAAADGATGLVGAALTSVTALSISAQRLARKNERPRLEPAQKADRNPTPSAPNITKRWDTA